MNLWSRWGEKISGKFIAQEIGTMGKEKQKTEMEIAIGIINLMMLNNRIISNKHTYIYLFPIQSY
jgi:hypothetical protein